MLTTKVLNPLMIRQQLHLSQERMGHLLRVSAKTLWRWENKNSTLNRDIQQRLSKLKQIAELAEKIYTPEGVETFLSIPIAEFDSLSAYELMTLGKYDQVLGALAADYEGLGY
ncbi:helix-turn-helix transcriptional regulator [Crocosphaera sp. UHCC 0190]|uniref:helix-turn-helix domain-containing protein n=1 Tax=Crocosphaera sp. UHCC 0190 TaxID=3110246 RepID=UPI002B215252|nr:helix-turn-helix transcriptional regulator [Crocosphaera sp. UHCC 0190]MEA5508790.1 helix-turn-helix transcriptional regulator [Crocosphaera sp. UHCC 0190]